MDISKSIKFFMYFHDLNQGEFGEGCGVGKTNVSRWVNGNGEPSLYMIEKMAKACGVEVSAFIAQGELMDSQSSTTPMWTPVK